MKTIVSLIFLLSGVFLFAQGYDSVHIEKGKPDEDNSIFVPGRRFEYQVSITRAGAPVVLTENTPDSWSFKPVNPDSVSRIFLAVIAPKNSKRTNKRQTELVYGNPEGLNFIESTGAIENEKNTWIHPPRTGFFKSLEICPFPYVKLPLESENTWTDRMTIGPQWSNPDWATWEGDLELDYSYRIIGTDHEMTEKIGEETWRVEAKALSRIGESKLSAWYSETMGFVRLSYTLPNGDTIDFNLSDDRFTEKVLNSVEEVLLNEKSR
jgi:hypothetical protein